MFTLKDYKVSFDHYVGQPSWIDHPCNGWTQCVVIDTKNNVVESDGATFCSSSDQFNKATGRKVALTRALKPFDKETRTRFWKAYFEAQGGVK